MISDEINKFRNSGVNQRSMVHKAQQAIGAAKLDGFNPRAKTETVDDGTSTTDFYHTSANKLLNARLKRLERSFAHSRGYEPLPLNKRRIVDPRVEQIAKQIDRGSQFARELYTHPKAGQMTQILLMGDTNNFYGKKYAPEVSAAALGSALLLNNKNAFYSRPLEKKGGGGGAIIDLLTSRVSGGRAAAANTDEPKLSRDITIPAADRKDTFVKETFAKRQAELTVATQDKIKKELEERKKDGPHKIVPLRYDAHAAYKFAKELQETYVAKGGHPTADALKTALKSSLTFATGAAALGLTAIQMGAGELISTQLQTAAQLAAGALIPSLYNHMGHTLYQNFNRSAYAEPVNKYIEDTINKNTEDKIEATAQITKDSLLYFAKQAGIDIDMKTLDKSAPNKIWAAPATIANHISFSPKDTLINLAVATLSGNPASALTGFTQDKMSHEFQKGAVNSWWDLVGGAMYPVSTIVNYPVRKQQQVEFIAKASHVLGTAAATSLAKATDQAATALIGLAPFAVTQLYKYMSLKNVITKEDVDPAFTQKIDFANSIVNNAFRQEDIKQLGVKLKDFVDEVTKETFVELRNNLLDNNQNIVTRLKNVLNFDINNEADSKKLQRMCRDNLETKLVEELERTSYNALRRKSSIANFVFKDNFSIKTLAEAYAQPLRALASISEWKEKLNNHEVGLDKVGPEGVPHDLKLSMADVDSTIKERLQEMQHEEEGKIRAQDEEKKDNRLLHTKQLRLFSKEDFTEDMTEIEKQYSEYVNYAREVQLTLQEIYNFSSYTERPTVAKKLEVIQGKIHNGLTRYTTEVKALIDKAVADQPENLKRLQNEPNFRNYQDNYRNMQQINNDIIVKKIWTPINELLTLNYDANHKMRFTQQPTGEKDFQSLKGSDNGGAIQNFVRTYVYDPTNVSPTAEEAAKILHLDRNFIQEVTHRADGETLMTKMKQDAPLRIGLLPTVKDTLSQIPFMGSEDQFLKKQAQVDDARLAVFVNSTFKHSNGTKKHSLQLDTTIEPALAELIKPTQIKEELKTQKLRTEFKKNNKAFEESTKAQRKLEEKQPELFYTKFDQSIYKNFTKSLIANSVIDDAKIREVYSDKEHGYALLRQQSLIFQGAYQGLLKMNAEIQKTTSQKLTNAEIEEATLESIAAKKNHKKQLKEQLQQDTKQYATFLEKFVKIIQDNSREMYQTLTTISKDEDRKHSYDKYTGLSSSSKLVEQLAGSKNVLLSLVDKVARDNGIKVDSLLKKVETMRASDDRIIEHAALSALKKHNRIQNAAADRNAQDQQNADDLIGDYIQDLPIEERKENEE